MGVNLNDNIIERPIPSLIRSGDKVPLSQSESEGAGLVKNPFDTLVSPGGYTGNYLAQALYRLDEIIIPRQLVIKLIEQLHMVSRAVSCVPFVLIHH